MEVLWFSKHVGEFIGLSLCISPRKAQYTLQFSTRSQNTDYYRTLGPIYYFLSPDRLMEIDGKYKICVSNNMLLEASPTIILQLTIAFLDGTNYFQDTRRFYCVVV